MADISKINVNNTEYNVKDSTARSDVSNKMNKANPTGTGSLSLNRASGSTIGTRSVATGSGVTASGGYSFATGYQTTASGAEAFAEGSGTIASGEYGAHAEGLQTTASGNQSHAEGYQTTASGANSHAEGSGTTASGGTSHAEGSGTTANGVNSHVEGYDNTINILEGQNSAGCHVEGYSNTASGMAAHAEGRGNTITNANYGHAEGYNNVITGGGSHAEGSSNNAAGQFSHCEGQGTKTTHRSQHVFGEYNVADTSTATFDSRGTYIEIVGKGTANNARSNARTLDWNGNEVLAGNLKIKGNQDVAVKSDLDITTAINTPSAIQTFSDGGDNIPMKSCEVAIVAQQASGTPSPSNPLPIIGFNTVDVVVTGKNLFNKNQTFTTGNIKDDGTIGTTGGYVHSDFIKVKPNTTYVTSGSVTVGNGRNAIALYDINKNFIVRLLPDSSGGWSFSTSASTYWIRMNMYKEGSTPSMTEYTTIQLEEGSTATAYESFGTITTVSLGQTIYGGTAELVGGNGSKTFDRVDLSTLDWIYIPSANVFYAANDLGEYRGAGKIGLCEIYDVVDNVSRALDVPATNNVICGYTDTNIHRIYCKNTAYTDPTAFANSMTGKYLVYRLATPTTFSFTGATIPTLSGTNNVYADSGDINSLEYFNDKANDFVDLDKAIDYHEYTETERIVGKWIDGKTLYEQTFYCSVPNNSISSKDTGIPNTAKVVDIRGIAIGVDSMYPIPYTNNSSSVNVMVSGASGTTLKIYVATTGSWDGLVYGGYVTIQYTK